MSFRILAFLVSLPLVTQAGLFKQPDVDFSNYDVPVYEQIVDRIKANVAPRLDKPLKHDRYFMIPFAYEDKGNHPELSHSFISVIRVFASNKPAKLTPGLPTKGKYLGWEFEAFTISWLPADFLTNPHLCVFDGTGSRLFPKMNRCPILPGRNFTLAETIKLAVDSKNALAMWGPYEVAKPGFDLGVKRKELLDSGTIKYRADDRLYRKDKLAISCFHAMAGLEELYPNGGVFGSGFKMWGFNGTARVLIEYQGKVRYKQLLLDPVDEKKDRYGFVCAPAPNCPVPYAPLERASAYHR